MIVADGMHTPGGGSQYALQLDTVALVTSSAGVDLAEGDKSGQTMRLALFIQRMFASQGGGNARIVAAQDEFAAPSELSRSVAPIIPASRLLAFDMTSLHQLRDWRKIAVLAPTRLQHDLAALDAAGERRLASLAELQDGLRHCTSAIVFDPGHKTRLLALGTPRVELLRLPALMPFQDTEPMIDLLLINHAGAADATLCTDLASALRQAMPDLVFGQTATDGASDIDARIHLHVGTPVGNAAALRVIDSHAMNRPVIQFAIPPKNVDPAMWVDPMRTGLCAETIEATIDALGWLDAHPVFIGVFASHATKAVEVFNAAVEATLRDTLLPGDPI